MTTKITEKNISNLANFGIQWQSVITADGSTVTSLEAGKGYFIDTSSAAGLVSLPTSSSAGDTIAIKDYAGTFATNNLIVQRNGHNIQGNANNGEIVTNRASLVLVYVDSTKGWIYTNESNVGDLQLTQYISATGGTVTTSGFYKIHTFTGDGCFVVSQAGTGQAPSVVDYLVVAGGGAGGNGNPNDGGAGGGAGGFRESSGAASGCYSASPLGAGVTGLTITATTYPITVGGGGASQATTCTPGAKGSDSIFSTVTSAGGGGGDANGPQCNFNLVKNGGSGGGGHQNAGGSGNTPPVSPPQGTDGGFGGGNPTPPSGAGGGGALTSGSNNQPLEGGGPGGNGATTSISNSPTTYAGGGGGSNSPTRTPPVAPAGTGGSGGGGAGSGCNATANTGGGGGGSYSNSGAGGKGIVIIRYKYQ